jgi:hypothetical protein
MAYRHQELGRLVGHTQPKLREAFLAVAAPLPRRPEPGWVWHNVARAEPHAPYPWQALQRAVLGAVRAGARREDVVRFYSLLIEEALDAYDVGAADRERMGAVQLLRKQAAAMEAQAVAHAFPSRATVERAVAETREAIVAGECYVAAHAKTAAAR